VQELSGKTIHVRESSSYYSSLRTLSDQLVADGKPAIDIQPISESLEDEDLLEMVAAGLLPWAVIDDHKAQIFEGVFEKLTLRPDLVLREGSQLAWAFRPDSPQFTAALNAHMENYKEGSLHGNMLINRYLRDFKWVENALEAENYGRFKETVDIFKKYGEQYGMDYLLVAAQGYQESRLDHSAKSHAGAVGIMQLLPTTAADPNVGIPDISTMDANIHAGVKYVNFLRSRYFNDPAIDNVNQTLLAMASYNAGPARIASLRKKAAEQGLDPNRWFGNVEVVVAKEVGREPVQYVANIYKYYISYRMAITQIEAREAARKSQGIN
jgi:membrane-bound lytic murein transglycosylase MltF